VRRVLATLEQRLGVTPFLGGQNYSIADIATEIGLAPLPASLTPSKPPC
jgi:glutathione S-transferase